MANSAVWIAAAIALAVAVDLLFGDPPNAWHPVARLGRLLTWLRARLERGSPRAMLAGGVVAIAAAAGVAALAGSGVSRIAHSWGWPGVLLEAIALKIAIALRGLLGACSEVGRALERDDVAEARRLVGWHLVSRPTARLDAGLIASATVESAAENLTDALVGPLACYLAFGLGGAWLYRAVNTADAMLGYRVGTLEYFGKASARLDDLLNLIPARLAAVAIVLSAGLLSEDARGAWRIMRRDHGRTSSPNAGWTLSAIAGALGVRLEKPETYRLGNGELPRPRDCARAVRVVATAALGMVAAVVLALLVIGRWR